MSSFTFNGHTYEIVTTPMSWLRARDYAVSQGGYLAIVGSKAENDAIYAQVASLLSSAPRAPDGGDSAYVWLGASDIDSEGNWKWVDGTGVTSGYTNWGVGAQATVEPDNYENQDAMGMGLEGWPREVPNALGYASQWNDVSDTNALYFVIESVPLTQPPASTAVESAVSYTLASGQTNLRLTGTQPLSGTGNAGDNTLTGNAGNNKLSGLAGNDELTGGEGNDQLLGGDGDDFLDGGSGADKLTGGSGDDTYVIADANASGKAADTVTEKANQGSDKVISSMSYTLPSDVEVLVLNGGGDLQGTGNKVANTITGGVGANTLDGNDGNDTLTGGGGADRFVFSTKLNAAANWDQITDFTSGQDHLVLSKKIFTGFKTTAVGQSPAAALLGAFGSADASDRLLYDALTGAMYYDADGSGAKAAVKFAGPHRTLTLIDRSPAIHPGEIP